MKIEAFLLCDAATDQLGKLNVLGAFDSIFARKTPIKHPACAITARIRFDKSEEGSHPIKVNIIDYDGNPAAPALDGNISVHVREDADSSVMNLILNIQGLTFKSYGQYRIDLTIDGQIKTSLPFYVRQPPNRS